MVQFDCIERPIRRFFYKYGGLVSRHPLPFIVIPTLLALGLATGFAFLERNVDIEYLYSIEPSQVRADTKLMESCFPPESEGYIQVTAVTRDPAISIWSKGTISELLDLDGRVRNEVISGKTRELRWEDVCLVKDQKCVTQPMFELIQFDAANVPKLQLQYPTHNVVLRNGTKSAEIFLPRFFGGVKLDENGTIIKSIRAMRLIYPLGINATGAIEWEREIRGMILSLEDAYDHVTLSVTSSTTLSDELSTLPSRAMMPFTITVLVLCVFAVLSCLSLNCVISKPWLGLSGILSSAFAIAAGMGFLLFFLPFTDIVTAVPFLALGIGLDDMFVMIASWRKTSVELSIEQRMSKACSDAAVSITITTLTDVLAIGVGAVSSLPSVRMFCIFTAVCVFLDYIYIVTVFAGCMVYSGRREAAKHHACCINLSTVPASEAETRSCCFRTCCTGGTSKRQPYAPKDRPEHRAMLFFRDTYGTFIMATPTKIVVGIGYAFYLAGAIWGCLNIKQGLEMAKTVADDSYATKDFANWDLYFRTYDLPAEVVVYGELDYSYLGNYDKINQLLSSFERTKYFHGRDVTKSWLRDFVRFTEQNNISVSYKTLPDALNQWYQVEPSAIQYKSDIDWNSDKSKIEATRYRLYPKDQTSPEIKMAMQAEMVRLIGETSLNATVVSPLSIFYEAWLIVLPNALQAFGIATAAVLVVCLFLIPNPVCSVYVALSIASMCIGLIGYMSLWGVAVDAISMVNIIMAVGFSVDFTAHITYAFTTASGSTRQERVRKALYGLGVPIGQGSLSTILGVLVLCVSFVYFLRVFFVTIFLTMVFGALHGLVFIPVLLSLIGPARPEKRRKATPGSDLSHTTYSSSIKPVGVVKPMRQIKPEPSPPTDLKSKQFHTAEQWKPESIAQPKPVPPNEFTFKQLDVKQLESEAAFEQYLEKLAECKSTSSTFTGYSTIYLPRQEGYSIMPMKILHPRSWRGNLERLYFSKIDVTRDMQGDFVSQVSTVER